MQAYKTYLWYCLVIGSVMSLNAQETQFKSVKKVSIALLHPASSGAVTAVIQGFQEELAKETDLQCSYTIYDHGGDKALLRSYAEEITNKDFDLIFTIGHVTSFIAAEIARKKRCRTPMVFAAVKDPASIGVVPKDRDHTCFITGSSSQPAHHHEQGFALLLLLKPDIKRLLIPYAPQSDSVVQRDVADAEAYMLRHGVAVQKVEVLSVKDCVERVATCIQEGDIIWINRDASVMAGVGGIAKLASRHNAMVYASNFSAIAEGATFSFTADDKGSGINAGKKAQEILVHGKHPADVAITPAPYQPYLWINQKALESQKLKIDPRLLFLIENTGIAAGYSS